MASLPSKASAAAVQKLTALHHHDACMFVQQDTRRQSLVLPQSRRSVAAEPDPTRDLVVDDLGRYGYQLPCITLAAYDDVGGHADREIVGVAFGDHRVDLEARQVDDGHDRHVARYCRFLIDQQIADDAVDLGELPNGVRTLERLRAVCRDQQERLCH